MGEPLIPLTALAPELRRLTGGHVTYRTLYNRVLNGDLPAEQVNGRYQLNRKDLPLIAERLGLPIAAERQRATVAA